MKQHRVAVTRHGRPEVLQVIEEDPPEPQKGDVRVNVLAAGMSAYDLMFRRSGKLPGTPKVPFTLGEDVVGVVDKLGNGVTSFEVGQRVAGATFSIGGGRQVMRSYKAVRRGGRLVWFGVASTKQSGLRGIPFTLLATGLLKLLPDGKRIPTAPDLGKDPAGYKKTLPELIALLATGSLAPIIAQRIPLCEAARAHEWLERGGYAGKVVLVTDEG